MQIHIAGSQGDCDAYLCLDKVGINGVDGSLIFYGLPMNKAILLLGPTGSGKSPLGNYFEQHGFLKIRCFHFDFGENLRKIAGIKNSRFFTKEEIAFIRKVLYEGVLLENEHFHIAKKILAAFVKKRKIRKNDLIILNGLPRHTGQAEDISSVLKIEFIILLQCDAKTVFNRISKNMGGDRKGRSDDSTALIKKKLLLFKQKTSPLIDYFQRNGVRVETVDIALKTEPSDIITTLNTKFFESSQLFSTV
jgi:adenylate kinase family enzyme